MHIQGDKTSAIRFIKIIWDDLSKKQNSTVRECLIIQSSSHYKIMVYDRLTICVTKQGHELQVHGMWPSNAIAQGGSSVYQQATSPD